MWNVVYTKGAERDVDEINDYISNALLEPTTAERQVRCILDAAEGLDNLPFRHRIYDVEPWCTRGFRFFPVDNFLIFYLADESKRTVTIFRIIYGGRDISAQLEQSE